PGVLPRTDVDHGRTRRTHRSAAADLGPQAPRRSMTSFAARHFVAVMCAIVTLFAGGCGSAPDRDSAADLAMLPWEEVEARARGTRVVWRMWRGDPSVNAYLDDWVAPRLSELFGIELVTVAGQGQEMVNQLL